MLTAKKISLTLTYLVCLGCFSALYGIADTVYFFPLLLLFLLGILNELRFHVYLTRWMLNAGGILTSLFFLLELSFENMVKPFANLLLLLLVIKSLEEKNPRDIYQMLLLSLFGIAVSATFRLDISFLVFFLYELFLGSIAFMFTNVYANVGNVLLPSGFVNKYLRFSLIFPLGVAVTSIPFFIALPRTQTPLFDLVTKREGSLVSGIADEVELGKVGEVQQDNTVVMRVYGNIPRDPYWRVSVFDTLVNTKWIRTVEEREPEFRLQGDKFVGYTVILEPTYDTFMPVLDYPLKILKVEGIKGKVKRLKGGYYETEKPISKPLRYRVLSVLKEPRDYPHPVYLDIPEEVPERIVKLVKELSRNRDTEEEKIEAVISFFKKGFSYTLKLEEYEGDPLENFLFKAKRGNCEYFASATALLLRLMGIPSRIVGGFKGYIKNEYGDYYIVTNSMAHVWVEAYVNGRWLKIDTTPPYISPAVRRISKLDLIRDAIISFWYENVVDFSTEKQIYLLRSAIKNIKKIDIDTVKYVLKTTFYIGIFLVITGGLIHIYLFRIRKTPENLYRRLIAKLEKTERLKLKNLLPEDILKRLKDKPYYSEVKFITYVYQKSRYSPYKVTKRELEEAYRVLRKIQ